MVMSWGWTPLCRVGSERYRISTPTERGPPPSVVLTSGQCEYGLSQLPPETSISLAAPRQGTVSSSQLPLALASARTQLSSQYNSQPPVDSQSTTTSAEERIVRRSPRLARGTRVSYREETASYREDGEQREVNRARNPWNNQSQQEHTNMWNSDRGQSNCNQQTNKNYSVYNYDGQSHPLINTSVSIVYNHSKNLLNNVAQPRVPLTIPFTSSKPAGNTTPNSVNRSVKLKVTIKSLDFYDIVTSLLQEEIIHDGIGPLQRTFRFFLNNDDVKHLLDKKRKHPYLVQLRFCKLDGSCEQSDYYPVTHQVAVNHQLVLLPGLETMPRGAMRPMDITHFCQVNVQSCNFITIRCLESCKIFLSVVQKYTSQDLLSRLEEKCPTKEEETTNEIKKKLQGDQADDGIASTTLQCSLLCPLSRTRMKLPCRASSCNHLQCFDAATYLQLNECKAKWSCPVCYQPALYINLQIDGYFKKIIDDNVTADKVELQPDGSWTLVDATAKKKPPQVSKPVSEERSSEDRNKSVDAADKTVTLDSDDDEATENSSTRQDDQGNRDPNPVAPPRNENNSPEIVTLSDDDSVDGETPSIAANTYTPTYTSTPLERARHAENNVESPLSGFNYDIWGRGLSSMFTREYQQYVDVASQYNHSNSSLYIPMSRTSITPPQFNSTSITITRATNQPNSSSSDRLRNLENSQGSPEKDKSSTSRVSKSKITRMRKKISKRSRTTNKGKRSQKSKRRRIIVESSDSDSDGDSDRDTSKNSGSHSKHKKSSKQKKHKRKRQTSDSSEGDKSSIFSSSSDKSTSSVNLATSNNNSNNSSSSSSSSSDSSDNDDSPTSDDSFTAGGVKPSETSRVLRSRRNPNRKKK